jgi:hypothetical protein
VKEFLRLLTLQQKAGTYTKTSGRKPLVFGCKNSRNMGNSQKDDFCRAEFIRLEAWSG